ncbi:efflux RND transporter permease subunit [bacterium]|nr:efflux RND transporter permease subunit [bacterium]
MRALTRFSVKFPVTIVMLMAAIVLLGIISFMKLGVDLFPDLNNPRIYVEINAGERPPEEIEKQHVDRIESLAIRQKNVMDVSSISRSGSAQIIVEYAWDTDMDEAYLDLQKALAFLTQDSGIDKLTLTQHDPNAQPVMLIALSHPEITDMNALRRVSENYIRNELIRLEGIAEVELAGQQEREVCIHTDPYLLEAFGVSASGVAAQIQSYNLNVSGGSIVEMGTKYIIKGVGTLNSLDDLRNLVVGYTEKSVTAGQSTTDIEREPVFLKDIGRVAYNNKDPQNMVFYDGQRAMGLSIFKETKYNTVKAVKDINRALIKIRKALPGYEFTIIENQGEFINNAISEVKETALIGICLAIIVLFIFLRRFGATLIVSIAIPISVIATFNLMYFNGLSLNIMTLGGLALGAGMLVDNAIVVMENIYRHIERGLSIKEAAIEGAAQVGGAITASTLTTIVVFLPIVYLHGAAGELFKDQAWTVAFALISSLVVAILMIPMLATRLIKPSAKEAQTTLRFNGYSRFLDRILDRRYMIMSGAVILIVIAVILLPFVGSEFLPKADSGSFNINVSLAEGTDLELTARSVSGLEERVRIIAGDNLDHIYSQIGPLSGMSSDVARIFDDENTAIIHVLLKEDRKTASRELIMRLSSMFAEIPDLEVQFDQDETALASILGTEEAPILVEVKGEDLDLVAVYTDSVLTALMAMPDLLNIESSFADGAPEVDIVIDRLRAGMLNLSVNQLTSQLRDYLEGKDAGTWESEGELEEIRIVLPDISIRQLSSLTFEASGGARVRLDEVATINISQTAREIHRRNQTRIGKVTAQLEEGRPLDHVVADIRNVLDDISFPPGIRAEITGEEEKRQDAMSNLIFALLLSVVLVYMVLASQFESLMHPFTIILTIPLAVVGAVFAFFILGRTLNIMAFIGIIMLVGIAVNDSIILVDAILQNRRNGMGLREAVLAAGQRRIRPIIMTSLTTILALLPLTFGFGQGAVLRSPMALAVIGGLITSTILTLIVIPCVYFSLEGLKERLTPEKL